MSEESIDQTLVDLARQSGVTDLSRVTTYKGYRPCGDDGGTKEVTIEVRERALRDGAHKWFIYAYDEQGRVATGNPDATLRDAIRGVHWAELDGPIE